jgi:FdhE protein
MTDSADINLKWVQETAILRLPVAQQVFSTRSARFRSLATNHPIGDFLAAMAGLADAQVVALGSVQNIPRGGVREREVPLAAVEWPRDEAWHRALSVILSEMRKVALPSASQEAMERLSAFSPAELESIAGKILALDLPALDLACAPFLGAALQTYWTVLAGMANADSPAQGRRLCPICDSAPVAGIVLGDRKLRYLVCGLCATQWYIPRLTCSHCGSTAAISYLHIEGDTSGAKAECCSDCHTYLKLFYVESAPSVEPFADDVATLPLDFLVSGEGFSRAGINLFLLPLPAG